jgi:hypothetical protein
MDKHKQEAILEAYKLVREQTVRLANKRRTDPALVEDAVHEGILNVVVRQNQIGNEKDSWWLPFGPIQAPESHLSFSKFEE